MPLSATHPAKSFRRLEVRCDSMEFDAAAAKGLSLSHLFVPQSALANDLLALCCAPTAKLLNVSRWS